MFTRFYENFVINLMEQISNSDVEVCKDIIRKICLFHAVSFIVLISFLNRKLDVNFPIPTLTLAIFLMSVYAFYSFKAYSNIKSRMALFIKICTVLFVIAAITMYHFNLNIGRLSIIYAGIIIVFGAIMLYNEISFYVSKFIVMVIKKIAKYSLSKTNKINLFVHLLQIVFEIPLWIYILTAYFKG